MRRVRQIERFSDECHEIQLQQLTQLLDEAKNTEYGRKHDFARLQDINDFKKAVPLVRYEDLRPYIMQMVEGKSDVLWRGVTRNFAQSSGTSDGKSKYVPITKESFSRCHYRGGVDCVALYLAMNPQSRIFDGKAFILGGSYANELHLRKDVVVGDLSANLINNINPLANLVRIPDKQTALMEDWSKKLPALVEASRRQNVTNISGVPSWFLSVIKEVMRREGVESIHDVWHNLEVFFHGGISFKPYRSQYESITDKTKMHFVETYNASEGFFAVQSSPDSPAMLLLLDLGVFTDEEIEEFNDLYLHGADQDRLAPLLDAAQHRYDEEIEWPENGKADFKMKCKQFVKVYSRIAAIMAFDAPAWEKMYWYLRHLIPQLRVPENGGIDVSDLLDKTDLNTYCLSRTALNEQIVLNAEEAIINPLAPTMVNAGGTEEDRTQFDIILQHFNERHMNGWDATPEEQRTKVIRVAELVRANARYLSQVVGNPDTEAADRRSVDMSLYSEFRNEGFRHDFINLVRAALENGDRLSDIRFQRNPDDAQ